MRACWIDSWDGPLRRGDRPAPEPGAGEVLVEVEACGVGLTVLNCIRGDLARPASRTPRIPGHEYVGRVVGTGPGVDAGRRGQRVVAYFYRSCGACRRCLAAAEPLCERLDGFVGVDADGGYAEYAAIAAHATIRVPDDLDAVAATTIPDAVATPLHVARRASIGEGDRVAVIGAGGGVGIHMAQIARLRGAQVLGLEAGAAKRDLLVDELEIDVVDSGDFAAARLPAAWSGGADVVVDLVGSEESLAWAIASVRGGGRVVALTTFPGVYAAVSPRDLVLREVSVLGSRYASRAEVALAADLVTRAAIRPVVSRCVTVEEIDALHADLRAGAVIGRGALVWNRESPNPSETHDAER